MTDDPLYNNILLGGRVGTKDSSVEMSFHIPNSNTRYVGDENLPPALCLKNSKKTRHGTAIGGAVLDTGIVVGGDGFLTDDADEDDDDEDNANCLRSNADVKVKPVHDMVCALEGDEELTNSYFNYINQKVQMNIALYGIRPSVKCCAYMVRECYQLHWKGHPSSVDGSIVIGGYDNGKPQLWIANKAGARRAPKYCFAGSGGAYLEVSVRNAYNRSNSVEKTIQSFEEGMLAASKFDSCTGGVVRIATIQPGVVVINRVKMEQLMNKHRVYFREILVGKAYGKKLDREVLDLFEEKEKRLPRDVRLARLSRIIKKSNGKHRRTSRTVAEVLRFVPKEEKMLMKFLRCVRFLEHIQFYRKRMAMPRGN